MKHQIESRTFVTEDILLNEYEYVSGSKKNEKVNFTFIQAKTGKENTKHGAFTYKQALSLAREKRNDKRYKNFEFFIG